MNEVIARNIRVRVGVLTGHEARDLLASCVVRIVEGYGDDLIDLRSELIGRFLEPDEIERIHDRDDCSSNTPTSGDTEIFDQGPRLSGGTTAGDPSLAAGASALAGTTDQDLEDAIRRLPEVLNDLDADGLGPSPGADRVSAVEQEREIAHSPNVLEGKEPPPTKLYTAVVVRNKIVKTPYSTTIIGIPGRSEQEARVVAQEAALRLPDTVTRWEQGESTEPEFSRPEVIEFVEQPDLDEARMEEEFNKELRRQFEPQAIRTLAVGLQRIATSLRLAATEQERAELLDELESLIR